MRNPNTQSQQGFSLLELLIAMTIMLVMLSVISSVTFRAASINNRETRKADALVSAQAALNVMSREIGNSGFGIYTDSFSQTPANGIVLADSTASRIRVRSNFENVGDYSLPAGSTVLDTNLPGEDVTYYHDAATSSIVRYDPFALSGTPNTSPIVNKISNVTYQYFNYTTSTSSVIETATPTAGTGRVRITITVALDPVVGQPDNQTVTFTSEVTLRNSNYMLRQY